MTSGVKLKVDQLIEKFFYNNKDRLTRPVAVNVISALNFGAESSSESKINFKNGRKKQKIIVDDGQQPSTSKQGFSNCNGLNSKTDSGNEPHSPPTCAVNGDPQRAPQQHNLSQQSHYASAAAYAAAAGFGAFLNPQNPSQAASQHQQQQQLHQQVQAPPQQQQPTMDTYPLTAHMQSNSPNNYVTSSYDGYPTYYQHYQPVQSPASYQGNYVLQTSQSSPVSADGDDGGSLSHTARTSPETLVWLSENYEPCEGSSLPRCTLYSHYRKHCTECGIDPVNPASFGKLIRSVFRGLKTRRLGTRGNSKYHYYGIRIKPNSAYLNEIENERTTHHPRHQRRSELNSNPYSTRAAVAAAAANNHSAGTSSTVPVSTVSIPTANNGSQSVNGHEDAYIMDDSSNNTSANGTYIEEKSVENETFASMMGPAQVPTITVPGFENVEPYLITEDLELSNIHHFIKVYIDAWVEAIHIAERMELRHIKDHWARFWNGNFSCLSLVQNQMFKIVNHLEVAKFVDHIDQLFYQALLDMLMPNVLGPTPNYSNFVTKLRDFAAQIVSGTIEGLDCAPVDFVKQKVASAKAFAMRLKRYTYIQHLADACKSVLRDSKQVVQMYEDFRKIDFASIQEQAGWVCECDPLLVKSVFQAFEDNLCLKKTLEGWAEWMEAFVDQALASSHDKPLNTQIEKSKNLVLIWSYFGTAIIRHVTLKSALSFGSFHILKIFFDDYIVLLVEQRLAKMAGTPVACLLSKNWIGNDNFDYTMDIDEHSNQNGLSNGHEDPDSMMDGKKDLVDQNWAPQSTIQYVVASGDAKYVFANSNEILLSSNANGSYVMVPDDQYHQLTSQQLETIVYIDENGQQTTPDNSQTQYIVMTTPSSSSNSITQIHPDSNASCSRRSSMEHTSTEKQTADDLVLSGDILEADLDSPCQSK